MERYVIDGTWVIRRNWHAMGEPDKRKTVISFIQSLLKLVKKENYNTEIIVALDEGSYRYRSDLEGSENYKAGRDKGDHMIPLWEAIDMAQDILPLLGIATIRYPGVEADDIGYYYSTEAEKKEILTTLFANDRDWLIGLNPFTQVMRSDKETVTHLTVCEQFKLTHYSEYLPYKAIAGDGSDNIPPVTYNDLHVNDLLMLFKQAELPGSVNTSILNNIEMMRLDRIVEDLEVIDSIKEQENKVDLSMRPGEVFGKFGLEVPPYFFGMFGKYTRLIKERNLNKLLKV